MPFHSRPILTADLDECFDLICQRAPYAERFARTATRQDVIRCWSALLARKALTTRLLETSDLPAGQRILTFGMSAFVREDWLRAFLRDPFPFVGSWLVETSGESLDRVLLDDDEMVRANSHEGLHAFTIAYGWAPERPRRRCVRLPATVSGAVSTGS